MIIISAPGKIHLSGEHSVVYGQPALLATIDKRILITLKQRKDFKIKIHDKKLTDLSLVSFGIKKIYQILGKKPKSGFDLTINSQIPIASGLGSSASLAVALTGIILFFEEGKLEKEKINKVAYEIEKKQHGKPSGGDNTVICYGGFLTFQKIGGQFNFEQIKIKNKMPEFLLIDSGRPIENTGDMVKIVVNKIKIRKFQQIINDIGKVTMQMVSLFNKGKFNVLTKLIMENERLLEKIGVVGKKARKIIRLIEEHSSVAKICGAGGIKKGSGMILVYHQNLKQLKKILEQNNLNFLEVKLACEGLKIENT